MFWGMLEHQDPNREVREKKKKPCSAFPPVLEGTAVTKAQLQAGEHSLSEASAGEKSAPEKGNWGAAMGTNKENCP